jgi:phosphatidylglycerophosphate synthase
MRFVEPSQSPHLQQAVSNPRVRGPLYGFALTALAGAIGVAVLSVGLFGLEGEGALGLAVGLGLFLVASVTSGVALMRTYPHAVLGLCNVVTLVRLVIVASLAGALISTTSPDWAIFIIAMFALSLDGVDGWLARRQDLASNFGARFDMEVDAAFALVLALHAAFGGIAGFWVVALGLPHYLFVAANKVFPWLGGPLPERFSRKTVCVLQIGTLVALQAPILGAGVAGPLIVVASLALVWSFALDILWLWRSRP